MFVIPMFLSSIYKYKISVKTQSFIIQSGARKTGPPSRRPTWE